MQALLLRASRIVSLEAVIDNQSSIIFILMRSIAPSSSLFGTKSK
jgi:hypothetical protein